MGPAMGWQSARTLALCWLTVPLASAAAAPGQGFDVERYGVTLRPDLATTAVSGIETIEVRATADGVTQLAFTANALTISEATADAAPIAIASGPDGIRFTLPRALRRGQRATLRFRMAGTPARGILRLPGGALATSYFACDWMVCLQDAPGDKAHLSLDLLLPDGVESIAVGRGRRATRADGLTLHRWRSTRPYSPYLYAFAAGRFARSAVRTPGGDLLYLDGTGGGVDLPALFARSPDIAAFLAGKAGMPLPDRRYAQLLVPGEEAQESASASLIGAAELRAERAGDPASTWIIAHEMAHRWWGNLVTCATWRDFWLNEGITTFMVAAWKEQAFGPEGYRQELDVARRRVARLREIGFDKPLAWGGRYPSLGARRGVQYSKGALFLAHLRETIGDDAFWAGLRGFTRRHAGGTVTSRDFQRAMEAASRRDLSPLFAEWVYGESGD